MTKFRFACPVCLQGINGRNVRRHLRKVHGEEIPRGFEAFARRWMKEKRRRQVVRLKPWMQWAAMAGVVNMGLMAWIGSRSRAEVQP